MKYILFSVLFAIGFGTTIYANPFEGTWYNKCNPFIIPTGGSSLSSIFGPTTKTIKGDTLHRKWEFSNPDPHTAETCGVTLFSLTWDSKFELEKSEKYPDFYSVTTSEITNNTYEILHEGALVWFFENLRYKTLCGKTREEIKIGEKLVCKDVNKPYLRFYKMLSPDKNGNKRYLDCALLNDTDKEPYCNENNIYVELKEKKEEEKQDDEDDKENK